MISRKIRFPVAFLFFLLSMGPVFKVNAASSIQTEEIGNSLPLIIGAGALGCALIKEFADPQTKKVGKWATLKEILRHPSKHRFIWGSALLFGCGMGHEVYYLFDDQPQLVTRSIQQLIKNTGIKLFADLPFAEKGEFSWTGKDVSINIGNKTFSFEKPLFGDLKARMSTIENIDGVERSVFSSISLVDFNENGFSYFQNETGKDGVPILFAVDLQNQNKTLTRMEEKQNKTEEEEKLFALKEKMKKSYSDILSKINSPSEGEEIDQEVISFSTMFSDEIIEAALSKEKKLEGEEAKKRDLIISQIKNLRYEFSQNLKNAYGKFWMKQK